MIHWFQCNWAILNLISTENDGERKLQYCLFLSFFFQCQRYHHCAWFYCLHMVFILAASLSVLSGLSNCLGEHHGVRLQGPAEDRGLLLVHMAICSWYVQPCFFSYLCFINTPHVHSLLRNAWQNTVRAEIPNVVLSKPHIFTHYALVDAQCSLFKIWKWLLFTGVNNLAVKQGYMFIQ